MIKEVFECVGDPIEYIARIDGVEAPIVERLERPEPFGENSLEKADAVAEALSGVSQDKLPAAGARGRDRTLFLIDQAAAAKLPAA